MNAKVMIKLQRWCKNRKNAGVLTSEHKESFSHAITGRVIDDTDARSR